MTTPTYPENLPGVSEFQFTPTPQLVVTDIPRAARATHRISQIPGAYATAVWKFSGTQYQIFMTWWREELLEGHRWFRVRLPSAAGLQYTFVRFLTHRSTENKGYKFWIVTGSLEVLERRIRPEVVEQFLTTTLYPILDQAFLATSFDIPRGQMSPPVPINDLLQPTMSITGGSLDDLVKFGYGQDDLAPTLNVVSGNLRDTLHSTTPSDSVASEFSVLGGSLDIILITNEIPPESIEPSFTMISGSLT